MKFKKKLHQRKIKKEGKGKKEQTKETNNIHKEKE